VIKYFTFDWKWIFVKIFSFSFLCRRKLIFFRLLYRLSQKWRKFSHQLIYYFHFLLQFTFYLCLLKINFNLFLLQFAFWTWRSEGNEFPSDFHLQEAFYLKKIIFWWCEEKMKAGKIIIPVILMILHKKLFT